jgi:hypothetical protein
LAVIVTTDSLAVATTVVRSAGSEVVPVTTAFGVAVVLAVEAVELPPPMADTSAVVEAEASAAESRHAARIVRRPRPLCGFAGGGAALAVGTGSVAVDQAWFAGSAGGRRGRSSKGSGVVSDGFVIEAASVASAVFGLILRKAPQRESNVRSASQGSGDPSSSSAGCRSVAASNAIAANVMAAGASVGEGPTVSVAASSQRIGSAVVGSCRCSESRGARSRSSSGRG